ARPCRTTCLRTLRGDGPGYMRVLMSPDTSAFIRTLFPRGTVLRLVLSWAVVAASQVSVSSWQAIPVCATVSAISFVVLFATILLASFGVVREADHLAHQLGEPYGTLVLTLSVVAIEVILIMAVMIGPGESDTIGRDSIFAVMMIIMNLVTGMCLL